MERPKIKWIIKSKMTENREPEYYAFADDAGMWNFRKFLREEMESFSIELRTISRRDDELEEHLSHCKLGTKERREGLKEYYDRQPLVKIA